MTKKVFGIIFMIIAALFSLGLIIQIPRFIGVLVSVFSAHADAYNIGLLIGNCVGYAFMAGLTITLWIIGSKWANKKNKPTE
jgi:hypothetical protein